MSLTLEEVDHIAALARLRLNEEEKELFRQQLSAILESRGPRIASSIRALSSGSSGARNFAAAGRARTTGCPASPPRLEITASSRTTPGTIGFPGKWPASDGWLEAMRIVVDRLVCSSSGTVKRAEG